MNSEEKQKLAVQELGQSINTAIEQSPTVADAIEFLREMGFEPNLNLKLEISLEELAGFVPSEEIAEEETDLELTDEDMRTLQRMKIII